MISKNISVNIKKDQKVPFKERFMIVHSSKRRIDINQKFSNSRKNQKIKLNFEECERLMNLLYYYVLNGKYKHTKDKMIIYRE